MAQSSEGKLGGLLGLVIAGVFGVALVGSPFYLAYLQASDRAAERKSSGDVEDVRRIVLALDNHLAVINDYNKAESNLGGGEKVTAIPPEFRTSLDQTTKMLQATEEADKSRGTRIQKGVPIQAGLPRLQSVPTDMKQLISAHEKLLSEADQKLRGISATDNLGAARTKAIVEYARGRLQRNRAEFERWQARTAKDEAVAMAPAIAELKITQASLDAQSPAKNIAAIEERKSKLSAEISQVEAAVSKVSSQAADLKKRIAEQEKIAADAKQQKSELAAKSKGSLPAEYQQLADKARAAETEAMSLQNGTLENAVPADAATADITPPEYKSGSRRIGLRDVEAGLASLNATKKALEAQDKELEDQLAALKASEAKIDEQKSAAKDQLEKITGESDKLMAEAGEHQKSAMTADTAALKAFAESTKAAKMAANAAKARANDARTAAAAIGGAVPDDRLTRVSSDGDTEGSTYCLAGESAYLGALTYASQLLSSDSEKSADARSAATKLVNESLDLYKKAADAISKTKAGTISGRNYLWQVQVLQAASTLLRANLAESADAGEPDRVAAYKLLAESAKGKEQSPLLTPAIDTLVYLQEAGK